MAKTKVMIGEKRANTACSRQVGLGAFFKPFPGFEFILFSSRVSARPLAANAGRWAHKQCYKVKDEMEKRYWDDLIEGERLSCRPVLFTREDIINFAQQHDPQPFHVDEDMAKESIFAGLIASALHTISACTRVVVEAQGNLAIMSGLGIDEVRLFNPVRPGDVLSVEAYWSGLKRSHSKVDRGFANLKCKVSNQRGELVAEYGYKYLVACRNHI